MSENTAILQTTDSDFYNMPTSPATDAVFRLLGSRGNLDSFEERGKAVNHTQEIEVLERGNMRRVVVRRDVSSVTIEMNDVEQIMQCNKPVKKMFAFCLIKLNDQAYSDGMLKRNYIQFPLQELVDIGFYSRTQSARTGFKNAMGVLTSIKVKGELRKGKNKKAEQSAIEVLFTGANIRNGICTVFLNERINWGFIAAFYTILPRFYFALPNRASDLLYYIFYLARQNVKKVEKRGYFTVSMRALQERMGLPDAENNKNPKRTIIEPIEEAIAAIEEANNDPGLSITPVYDTDASVAVNISESYIEVSLSGCYANSFIKLSKSSEEKKQVAQKRRQTIAGKAKAANMAKASTLESHENEKAART